jgi:hypothetical protein
MNTHANDFGTMAVIADNPEYGIPKNHFKVT